MGLRPIVVDAGEKKEKLAYRIGAEAFVDFRKVDNVAAEVVKAADGVGAHGVIVTAWQTYKGAQADQLSITVFHTDARRFDRLHRLPHRRDHHVHRTTSQRRQRHARGTASLTVLPQAETYRQYRRLDAGCGGLLGLCETRAFAIDLRGPRHEPVR